MAAAPPLSLSGVQWPSAIPGGLQAPLVSWKSANFHLGGSLRQVARLLWGGCRVYVKRPTRCALTFDLTSLRPFVLPSTYLWILCGGCDEFGDSARRLLEPCDPEGKTHSPWLNKSFFVLGCAE